MANEDKYETFRNDKGSLERRRITDAEGVASAEATSRLGSAVGAGSSGIRVNPRPRKQKKNEDTMTYMRYINDWKGRGSPDEYDGGSVSPTSQANALEKEKKK